MGLETGRDGHVTGVQAIARILQKEGVTLLFGYPDHLFIDPCAELGIRPINARQERTAVAMADGYTRAANGRKTGVVAVQYGPGIETAFPGVAQAYSDSTPILVLCGHTPLARLGQQPNFDPVVNFREITKWAARLDSPERIPQVMRRAFTYLRAGRPGPVLIDVPLETATAHVPARMPDEYEPVKRTRSAPDPDDVAVAADLLLAAEAPLIHAGQGVLYAEACNDLRRLAELVEAPVMTTLPGKSAFPEDHPLAVGAGGMTGPRAVAHFIGASDLIVGVGTSLTASPFAAPLPRDTRIVHATLDERDLNKDYPATHAVLGDARLFLQELNGRLLAARRQRSPARERRDEVAAVKSAEAREWERHFTSDEVPISPYRVIRELERVFRSRETMMTHESGRPRDQVAPFWISREPRSYLGWGKSTQLGYGLGLMMGAKLARPERHGIVFMGDAAIGHNGMDIETAARIGIPLLAVVLNNGGMSRYEQKYPVACERFGFKTFSGDYAEVALALGAHAEEVRKPAELERAIRCALRAMEEGRPALLEVISKEEGAVPKHW